MAKNGNANVTKATISNDSATLTQNSTTLSGVRNKFQLSTKDGIKKAFFIIIKCNFLFLYHCLVLNKTLL